MRSRTPRYLASGPPMTTWRPGPEGPRRCRSGWPPFSTIRHDRQIRHGRSAGSAVHRSPAARSRASVVLPDAVGSDEQDGVGRRPADHRRDRTEGRRLPPGPGAVHRGDQPDSVGRRLAGRAALRRRRRLVRRRRRRSLPPPGLGGGRSSLRPPGWPPACAPRVAWPPDSGGTAAAASGVSDAGERPTPMRRHEPSVASARPPAFRTLHRLAARGRRPWRDESATADAAVLAVLVAAVLGTGLRVERALDGASAPRLGGLGPRAWAGSRATAPAGERASARPAREASPPARAGRHSMARSSFAAAPASDRRDPGHGRHVAARWVAFGR